MSWEFEDFYNINVVLKRTNFDTQSQDVLFDIPAVMYPSDPNMNFVQQLAPDSSEYPDRTTLYDIATPGRNVYPNLPNLIKGDELTVTALTDDATELEGIWRVLAPPENWNGGATMSELTSRIVTVIQIAVAL
jgi:hypothetical protein